MIRIVIKENYNISAGSEGGAEFEAKRALLAQFLDRLDFQVEGGVRVLFTTFAYSIRLKENLYDVISGSKESSLESLRAISYEGEWILSSGVTTGVGGGGGKDVPPSKFPETRTILTLVDRGDMVSLHLGVLEAFDLKVISMGTGADPIT